MIPLSSRRPRTASKRMSYLWHFPNITMFSISHSSRSNPMSIRCMVYWKCSGTSWRYTKRLSFVAVPSPWCYEGCKVLRFSPEFSLPISKVSIQLWEELCRPASLTSVSSVVGFGWCSRFSVLFSWLKSPYVLTAPLFLATTTTGERQSVGWSTCSITSKSSILFSSVFNLWAEALKYLVSSLRWEIKRCRVIFKLYLIFAGNTS